MIVDIYKYVADMNRSIAKGFRANNGTFGEWVKLISFAFLWISLVILMVGSIPYLATTLLEHATINFALALKIPMAASTFPFWVMFGVLATLIYLTQVYWFGFIIGFWVIAFIMKTVML